MKIVYRWLALGPAWLGCTCASAQYLQKDQDPITLESHYDQTQGDFVVTVTKRVLGSYSIAVEFVAPQNLIPPSRFRRTVRNSGTLLRLKPTQANQPGWCNFRFTYVLGANDARVDPDFVYRLPFSVTCDEVRADTATNFDTHFFQKARPKNWTAYYFQLQRGDTVFAARKGRVVEVLDNHQSSPGTLYASQTNNIRVEHTDGTIAMYQLLEKGSMMVSEGDMVYPDTPLALVGSFDGEHYKLAFCIYYIEDKNSDPAEPYDLMRAFTSAFVEPVFSTSQGAIKLQSGHTYQARVTQELVQEEMKKREIKKRKSLSEL